MKYLYLLSQSANRGYDTHDSCIVCAESDEEARLITPNFSGWKTRFNCSTWCQTPEQVTVEKIGVAKPSLEIGIVLASFNAG